jgi:hypothetical protein
MAWANSVGPDHSGTSVPSDLDLHFVFLVQNNPINQIANSVGPDQTARMCLLILTYTVSPGAKTRLYGVKGQ